MKLLRFESASEDCIDECLMVVPDEYDKQAALDEVLDLPDPFIASEFSVDSYKYDLDHYRPFYG